MERAVKNRTGGEISTPPGIKALKDPNTTPPQQSEKTPSSYEFQGGKEQDEDGNTEKSVHLPNQTTNPAKMILKYLWYKHLQKEIVTKV